MKKIVFLMSTLLMSLAITSIPAQDRAQQTKDDLLKAWEQAQKSDPQNKIFEKTGIGIYRFATERFPYSGNIRILNVAIDQYGEDVMNGYAVGVVEVELDSLSPDFMQKHAYSYGIWQRNNILYYDGKKNIWLNAASYQKELVGKYPSCGRSIWTGLLSSFRLWFFVLLLVFLFFLARRTNKQMKSAFARQDKALAESERAIKLTEQAIEISRDSNRILKEILEELKAQKK